MLETLQLYAAIFPEAVLVFGAMALLLVGALQAGSVHERAPATYGKPLPRATLTYWEDRDRKASETISYMAIALILAAMFLVWRAPVTSDPLFDGAFRFDEFARYMKIVALAGSALAIYMSLDYIRKVHLFEFEYPLLIVFATAGMLLMISANDLITLYLGLEIQSLALYVTASMRRDAVKSSEAGLKYFVLGALSSGMLLYGASLIYGFTGSTNFAAIAEALSKSGAGIGIVFGIVFLFAGFAFKISAVPFHMWTPDVYEGSPTPVTAFFAAAPKVAAMALIVRVGITALPAIQDQWQQIVAFIAIGAMVLGAFAAIGQTNIKRLMAYSSIGHMGFALVGLAVGASLKDDTGALADNVVGVEALIVYMTIYMITTIGMFACILSMRRNEQPVEDINDLAGLAKTQPPMAFALMLFLFSLAGIPPLAGFFAKFFVFAAAINAQLYALAIIGVLASVVGAFYYLRIIQIMFFSEPDGALEPMPVSLKWIMYGCAAFVVLFVVQPSLLTGIANIAARSLF